MKDLLENKKPFKAVGSVMRHQGKYIRKRLWSQ